MKKIRPCKLNIASAISDDLSPNVELKSWPPSDDFPIIVGHDGTVICRFGDSKWYLTFWTTASTVLNFGDGDTPSRIQNTSDNARLYRILTAWWLWRAPTPVGVATIKSQHELFSPIFRLCSENSILVSDLYKFPKVVEKIPERMTPRQLSRIFQHLHYLYEIKDELGFFILLPENLKQLHATPLDFEARQTAYMPPRIWVYQVTRLKQFIDDYLAIKGALEIFFNHCFEMYTNHYGSFEAAFLPVPERKRRGSPFSGGTSISFGALADSMGVGYAFRRWLVRPGESLDGGGKGINLLASYLTMTTRVGIAYLLNFTAMRINEAWNLRSDCLTKEFDIQFGEFWTISGETTKLFKDSDARWVTSPSVQAAVEAMVHVSKLRLIGAANNPAVTLQEGEHENPFLVYRSYEPWSPRVNEHLPTTIRPHYTSYQSLASYYRNLFEPNEMIITKEDLSITLLVTPNLDTTKFVVGKPWPLAWHQTRRTGAVNMQASGLVSESSLQYDLKHQSRMQSLYYAQGFSKLVFNEDARSEYVKALYDLRAIHQAQLMTNRFSSPHGVRHKATMLAPYTNKDLKSLAIPNEKGVFAYREVLLGVCLNQGHCSYGGIDNIVRCGGGDGGPPCSEVLYDKSKLIPIKELRAEIIMRRNSASDQSPYAASLDAQLRSADGAIAWIENLGV
ncbi:hypothetical protein [Pseudomonas amygdali]|uniref:Integrase n=1 Tax=Pseudomonas amygdali pv. tabaci TaxID=322 RepID=A0A3M6GNZ8_PSEAJ|nr:hypothetical protein [Pseudomonas amygdali]RMV94107.1 hypothetical protein ALP03_200043 [Pseudomonas amygdali pv. tabaci]